MGPQVKRIAAVLLVASTGLLATLKTDEGFTSVAVQPVPGDRWTYGHGETFRPDGTPVQEGDTITRQKADTLIRKRVNDQYEAGVNRCAGDIEMWQYEKDVLIEIAYQNGIYAVCSYSIIRKFRNGDYQAGCDSILTIDKLQGRHCSRPENRYRKDGCKGLMNRRERQYRSCMGL